MNPKVTIIIPNFNRAHVILDALESVRVQTHSNWECLIVDDRSLDQSEIIIKNYIQKDGRFKFIQRQKNRLKGAATCRNIGLENATGHFIQFLDSDDLIASNKLEVQLKRLQDEPSGALATCRYGISRPPFMQKKIFKGLKTFKDYKKPLNLLKDLAKNFTYFPLHVYLIPMSVIKSTGKWNEQLNVNDDGEYFSRILLNCNHICFCDNTYVIYRTGAGNRISTKIISEDGVESYIKAWNLIDQTIYLKTGIKNHLYVKSAKADMFNRLNRENKHLLIKHKLFLEKRWKNPNYFFAKFLNNLRLKILITSTMTKS